MEKELDHPDEIPADTQAPAIDPFELPATQDDEDGEPLVDEPVDEATKGD